MNNQEFLKSLDRREESLIKQIESIRNVKTFYEKGGSIFTDEIEPHDVGSLYRAKRPSKRVKELTDSIIELFDNSDSWHPWEIINKMTKKHPDEKGEGTGSSYMHNFCMSKFLEWSRTNNGPIMKVSRGLYKKRTTDESNN